MMPDFLAYGFMQRAFAAGILSATALSLVGVFIVLKRMSNIGEGLSNMAFAGLAFGVLLGAAPLPLALAASFAGVLAVRHLTGRRGVFGEAAVQVICSGGFALGAVLLSASRGYGAGLSGILFGSLLTVSDSDLAFAALLAAASLGAVALGWRQLSYVAFNEESARVSGLPVDRLNTALLLLTAASVVSAMRTVGILLASSMLVVPAAAAVQTARSFRQTLGLSAAYAAASVVLGLAAAYYLNVAAGGAVVLAQVLIFLAAAGLRRG
jgi:zinc transport system permease protein